MAFKDIIIRGKTIKVNPENITVIKVVQVTKDKFAIQMDWLPKNSAIITLNSTPFYDTEVLAQADANTFISNLPTDIPEISVDIVVDYDKDDKTVSPKAVKTYVDSKISTVYKPAGNITAAELKLLDATDGSVLGNVYNLTDELVVTTGDIGENEFTVGSEGTHPIGTNVVIAEVGGKRYKDVLAGFVDLSSFLTAVPQADENNLGGIKAKEKTAETVEVTIDTTTGKLYVPTYPTEPDIIQDIINNNDSETKVTSPKAVYEYEQETRDVLGWEEDFLGELIISSAVYVGGYDYVLIKAENNLGDTQTKFVRVKDFTEDTPVTVCDDVVIQYDHTLKEFAINGYAGCQAINIYGVYNAMEYTLGDITTALNTILGV